MLAVAPVDFDNLTPLNPLLKLIRVPPTLTVGAIASALRTENECLTGINFNVTRIYNISIPTVQYTNALIEFELADLPSLLERGSLLLGVERRGLFEVAPLLHCQNCQRFGAVCVCVCGA